MDAADSTPSTWSISDLVLPFTTLRQFREYMINLECLRDSVNEVMSSSDMKREWKDTIQKFDRIVDIDFNNCLKIEDLRKQEQ